MSRLSLRVAAAEAVVVQEDIGGGVEGDLGDRIIGPGAAITATTVLTMRRGVMDSLRDGGDMVRMGEEATTTLCHIRPMALTLVMGTDTSIR